MILPIAATTAITVIHGVSDGMLIATNISSQKTHQRYQKREDTLPISSFHTLIPRIKDMANTPMIINAPTREKSLTIIAVVLIDSERKIRRVT